MVVADYAGYSCPITGKWVEGRKAHTENLKRHGCRVLETGETEAVRRKRTQEEAALDRSVEQTVEQFYETLPTERREELAHSVQSGVDVAIERI
jgi:type II secretory pathway component PulC